MATAKRRTSKAAPKKETGLRQGLATYGDAGFSLFLRKAFIKGAGYSDDALDRPIVGIANTAQRLQPLPRQRAGADRGGQARRDAGRRPADGLPDVSLHESFAHPTSMFLRNLMAMDTEEMIRAQPMDAVVLIGGCDKTVPAQLMAARRQPGCRRSSCHRVDAHRLAIGRVRVGACTDCRRLWAVSRRTRSTRPRSTRSTTASWPASAPVR
jgi:dihydroxy-acid dehydratase